MNVKLTGKIS